MESICSSSLSSSPSKSEYMLVLTLKFKVFIHDRNCLPAISIPINYYLHTAKRRSVDHLNFTNNGHKLTRTLLSTHSFLSGYFLRPIAENSSSVKREISPGISRARLTLLMKARAIPLLISNPAWKVSLKILSKVQLSVLGHTLGSWTSYLSFSVASSSLLSKKGARFS